MTAQQASVFIILILAVLAVVLILRYKSKANVQVKAGKFGLNASGSNAPEPGATIEGGSAKAGSAIAEDETGRGAVIKNTNVGQDLKAVNRNPDKPDPKG